MSTTEINGMPSDARVFLEALFTGKPDEMYILLWTLPEKRSQWFRDVESAVQFAQSMHQHDLYVGVGLSGEDRGSGRRCPANEVDGIIGQWADLDLKSDAHSKAALPERIGDAMKILPDDLPPTFVVTTGNGAHAWWLFKEPLMFQNEQERRDGVSLTNRWQTLLWGKAVSYGWRFDRLADFARVLRVPGTHNCKNPADPKPVTICCHSVRRYNPRDLAEYLDEHGITDAKEEERTAQA
jgi:putative DNA primase/helicase